MEAGSEPWSPLPELLSGRSPQICKQIYPLDVNTVGITPIIERCTIKKLPINCTPYFSDPQTLTRFALLSSPIFLFLFISSFPIFIAAKQIYTFLFFSDFLGKFSLAVQSAQMAVSVSASTIPSLSSDHTSRLAAAASSSSFSSTLSSSSSLQFPVQLRRVRIGTKGTPSPLRTRTLHLVTIFFSAHIVVCMFVEKIL